MKIKLCILGLYLLQNVWFISCFLDPLSFVGFVAAGATIVKFLSNNDVVDKRSVTETVKRFLRKGCQMVGYCEGCEDYWIPGNMKELEEDLRKNVFGQPLAINSILSNMKYHYDNRRHKKKALALSFHGPPGVGKNLVSQSILKNLFKCGVKTNYVHFFRGSIDFTVKEDTGKYKEEIKQQIESKAEECNRSVFVFDEVDKIPDGVLNVLLPYLDYNAKINDIEYRNTIFIFLSNLGTKAISDKALQLWTDGVKREKFDVIEFHKIIKRSIFESERSDLRNLINHHVIDQLIPFLPLEREHLKKCLERDVKEQNQIMSEELFKQVLNEITFTPIGTELFATSGCKLIGEKAGTLIERELARKEMNNQRF